MNRLSKNFTLIEMIESEEARKRNIDNTPGTVEKQILFYLCQFILQPIRAEFGPIKISSGFRCPDLNRAIDGSITSQHRFGEAADIIIKYADKMDAFHWIIDNLNFGQAIIYDDLPNIIHISMPRSYKPEREVLQRINGNYKTYKKEVKSCQ